MIKLLTNKYVLGAFAALAIIASVILYGQKQYNNGFEARDLTAKVEMQKLENDILQKSTEERNRQMSANKKAQELQEKQIQDLEKLNDELEQKLKENEDAANNDDNRDRIGLDPSSVLRIDRIR